MVSAPRSSCRRRCEALGAGVAIFYRRRPPRRIARDFDACRNRPPVRSSSCVYSRHGPPDRRDGPPLRARGSDRVHELRPPGFGSPGTEEYPNGSAETQVARGEDPSGRSRPARPGLCPGTLQDDGRVLELRHQLLDHLDPDGAVTCSTPASPRGGPAASTIGWPLVSVFTLLIAASMAEIASAYPTAGGLYYWSSRMKNKDSGPVDRLVQPGRPGRDRRRRRLRRRVVRQLSDRRSHPEQLQPRLRERVDVPGDAREWPAPHHGGAPGHPAGPEHRRHPDRGQAQRRVGVVAHRDRIGHRRRAVPDQLWQGSLHPEPVRHRAAGHDGHRLRLRRRAEPGSRRRLRAAVRVPLLIAAGAVDLHGLRRVGPRGRGDDRRPALERLGRLHLGGRLGRGRIHRPAGPGDAPAPSRSGLQLQPRDGPAVQPVLRRQRGRLHDPHLQPGLPGRLARGRHRGGDEPVRPGLRRRRGPDALRLQPRPRRPRLALAAPGVAPSARRPTRSSRSWSSRTC